MRYSGQARTAGGLDPAGREPVHVSIAGVHAAYSVVAEFGGFGLLWLGDQPAFCFGFCETRNDFFPADDATKFNVVEFRCLI